MLITLIAISKNLTRLEQTPINLTFQVIPTTFKRLGNWVEDKLTRNFAGSCENGYCWPLSLFELLLSFLFGHMERKKSLGTLPDKIGLPKIPKWTEYLRIDSKMRHQRTE